MKADAKGPSGQSRKGPGKGGAVDNHDADDDLIVAELYVTHRNSLEEYLRRFVNEHDAQDVVHELILEVLRKHPAWISSSDARAVLFRAVRNRAVNFLRKSSRCDYLDPAVLQQLADKSLWRDGGLYNDADSKAHGKKLVPKLQRIYDLRLAGLCLQDIARSQGLSVATVKRRLLNIKRIIRLENI